MPESVRSSCARIELVCASPLPTQIVPAASVRTVPTTWLLRSVLFVHEHDPTTPQGPKTSRLTRLTLRPDGTVEDPRR